jgi:glycosyltransferase involved in cell wall biosynthesis
VGVDCGYGYAAVELIKAWQRMGIPVWSHDDDAPVAFNFGQVHLYQRSPGKFNIGYTPWESTGIPAGWVAGMNKMDEIWTPCEANAQWYRDAGVEVPVFVLPHGFNPDHFPLERRQVEPVFKFLHIGNPTTRKGGAVAYRVFKDMFGDDPRYHLTLKGKTKFKVYGNNVTVIDEKLPQEELRQLYLDHHCMVYPTNGEGFGFIPFQAAATGMPAIVTDWSGPQDYMDFCIPLRVEKLVSAEDEYPVHPHLGLWAKPDEQHLGELMQKVASQREYNFLRHYELGKKMREHWTWDSVAKLAVERMTESLNKLPA